MRWLIWGIVIFLALIIGISWVTCGPEYSFWRMPLSDFGEISTINSLGISNSNFVSQWIFTSGFLILAGAIFGLNIMYMKHSAFDAKPFKIVILILLMLGAIGTACPSDVDDYVSGTLGEILHIVHFVGVELFVGGFVIYIFVCHLLRYVKKKRTGSYQKHYFDIWLDLTIVCIIMIAIMYYLLLRILRPSPEELFFQDEIARKIVLIVPGIAAFFLKYNDL